jgi:hypothetical protein
MVEVCIAAIKQGLDATGLDVGDDLAILFVRYLVVGLTGERGNGDDGGAKE